MLRRATIAPLGTIDAGKAGKAGIPVITAVNVGALTSASAAADSAVQNMVKRQTRETRSSVISVRVLGFGDATSSTKRPPSEGQSQPAIVHAGYNRSKPVQLIGLGGEFDPGQMARLTEAERRTLRQVK